MDQVEEFIQRRFEKDCNWLNGNCYYFAVILQEAFPGGEIVYDTLTGHFLYWLNGYLYDWRGKQLDYCFPGQLINWSSLSHDDSTYYERIVRDCIK